MPPVMRFSIKREDLERMVSQPAVPAAKPSCATPRAKATSRIASTSARRELRGERNIEGSRQREDNYLAKHTEESDSKRLRTEDVEVNRGPRAGSSGDAPQREDQGASMAPLGPSRESASQAEKTKAGGWGDQDVEYDLRHDSKRQDIGVVGAWGGSTQEGDDPEKHFDELEMLAWPRDVMISSCARDPVFTSQIADCHCSRALKKRHGSDVKA